MYSINYFQQLYIQSFLRGFTLMNLLARIAAYFYNLEGLLCIKWHFQ